ncbi:hypothetical protein [Chitinophaga varians]|uniref:hypothetical protein n=1 Tax=Chitinophaga varians TaxID=2202339 RepID=UPI00165F39D5|nr:hypothetical protein [Chitinophaga varians]MBC9914786.1 hypothetical protein [Chitinophaga varians]
MELQHLDIDSYVNWYKELSYKLEYATANEPRINRYIRTGWDLFVRYTRNHENLKSKELSEWLSREARSIYEEVQKVKRYMKSDDLPDLWYVPTVSAWYQFDDVMADFSDDPTAAIAEKLASAAAPIALLKEELAGINKKEWFFTSMTVVDYPFYASEIESQGEGWVTQFALFVRDCHLAKWLYWRIQEQEIRRLPWNGTTQDLSELIKALSLTVLNGVPETDIVRLLGNVFDMNWEPFNDEVHSKNISELQDKKPDDTFTAQLHQAINNFRMNTATIGD